MPHYANVTVRDIFVLSLLYRHGPAFGYQILHDPKLMQAYFSQGITPSSLYHALSKIYRLGLANRKAQASKNAPSKAMYSISAAGRRVLLHDTGQKLAESYKVLFALQNRYRDAATFLQDLERLLGTSVKRLDDI
jgi:DNA-binding PadR family transcriptional regulator